MSFKNALGEVSGRLDTIRRVIVDLDAQEHAVQAKPVPAKQAVEALHAMVDRAAARYEQESAIFDRLVNGETPRPDDLELSHTPNGLSLLLCAIAGDAIKQRLGELVTKQIGKSGITAETREKQLAEIRSKRRELEIEEEHIIRDAEDNGMMIDRRHDADPAVVLGDLEGRQ